MTDPKNPPPAAPGWWRRLGIRLAALWKRLLAGFRGPDPVPSVPPRPPTPPGRQTERRSITALTVPARGFAFHFEVSGTFVWTTDGLERYALHSLVERFLPYAHSYLKEIATDVARGVEAHRGGDFENRLRERLDRVGEWKYQRRGQEVACRAHVRVDLDQRVQQHVRPFWERLITLDYERDVAARRARNVAGVSSQWAVILQKLLDGPMPGGAAAMTDDQLASVVRGLLEERAADLDPVWEALRGVDPQNEYAREGYFDLIPGSRPPQSPA
ncbi:hypothetical protein [Actinoplanes awajinensis]|uniref:hypothetical protein n=1 Tax=Actinoplanes awajinensis TaxID=135946 RepID=UPI000B15DE51|nr:hypothetical protein [Actinoplanes awajinensis]